MALNPNRAKICPARSNTSTAAPTASELAEGEIFINHADRSLGFKAMDGTIKYLVGREGADDNNVMHLTGNETVTGQKTFTQTIIGTCQRALWADLAEYYEADADYEPGTLLAFGGDKEVTAARGHANFVVSTEPGLVLNCAKNKHGIMVALAGRVPVKVYGRVEKFDKIVACSSLPGIGIVNNWARPDEVIALALRSKHTAGIGKVLCATKFNLV